MSTVIDGLPPGPATPMPLQTLAMMTRQRPYLERQRRRHGPMFSLRLASLGRMVVLSDPALIKHTFTADAATLHAGSRSPLRRILGDNSLLGIDEDQHLQQRRLLLPPFKGQRMKAYESLIEEIAVEEIDRLPVGVEIATAGAMQRITLRAILRAVFGATGARLARLEALLPPWTELGQSLSRFPVVQRDLGRRSPWGRFLGMRAEIDGILDTLIADARSDPELGQRTDVLALMVQARRVDGSPMTAPEIRDQLVTMLAAGHETTAHTLSWAVERLRRHPGVLARLVAEVDAGEGKAFRDATIREVQRMRPVIAFAGRHTMKPFEVGGYRLPPGVLIGLSAGLTHYDPRLFPDPERFDPQRFLDVVPETYTWIPFGGGIRRCIGATFAHMEIDVVLRVLLSRVELVPTTAPDEPWRFRGVAWAPAHGGRAVLRRRPESVTRAAGPDVAAA
ncbi:cytochrome P450 [Baekduia soli]|uniref:Cytochrome P450 n=1 Tax=Baekduia soli TaxID=496014 RepID=A0A5B8U4F7_9ACTN|nr:cytochrome P450 [Baekduia soli]QEC47986.1 cytochrome P450 [Baekduia soli]